MQMMICRRDKPSPSGEGKMFASCTSNQYAIAVRSTLHLWPQVIPSFARATFICAIAHLHCSRSERFIKKLHLTNKSKFKELSG